MIFFKKNTLSREEKKYMQFLAYDLLVELNENALPVINKYASAYKHGFHIYSMQAVAAQFGEAEDYFILPGCSECFALYVGDSDHYLILYNEELPLDKRRWYISRALALIKFGMLDNSPNEYFSIQRDVIHSEEFSYHFTCPDIILDECDIKSSSDIIKYCNIPFFYANKKSRYLAKATASKTFRTLEKMIKRNFSAFIQGFKQTAKTAPAPTGTAHINTVHPKD